MREKLIELLWAAGRAAMNSEQDKPEAMADHLLANGVIVLPCKVGDTVYDIYAAKANGEGEIRASKVTDIRIHLDKRNKAWLTIDGYYFAEDDFGKTVFLTREEAEAALKEGE